MDLEWFFERASLSLWDAFLLVWNALFFVFILMFHFLNYSVFGLNVWELYFLAFVGFTALLVGWGELVQVSAVVFFFLTSFMSFLLGSFFDLIFFAYFLFALFAYFFYEKVWRAVEEDRARRREWEREQRELEQRREKERREEEGGKLAAKREGERLSAEEIEKSNSKGGSGELSRRERRILSNIRRKGWVNVKEVMAFNGVSNRTAVTDLNSLISRGLIERRGSGRSTIYVGGKDFLW